MLTENSFNEYKSDFIIYGPRTITDDYGNEKNVYDVNNGTIHTMFSSVSDNESIALYGKNIEHIKQAVVYENTPIDSMDQVIIDNERYEVISIKQFQTHREIKVRKVGI